MTDFPTSNSRRAKPRKPGAAGPVIGSILVFLWAFVFSVSQSFTTVNGTANMPLDLATGIGVGLLGGLAGAIVVWLILYFILGGRRSPKGAMMLALLAGVAIVGAVPASGLRALGAGMNAEDEAAAAVRARVDARRDAEAERIVAERDAIVSQDFFEPRALGAPGGLARARNKLKALRELSARAEAGDDRLRDQARAELARVPVSAARRQAILRDFDAAVAREYEQAGIGAELSQMLFTEMDAQLDILSRTRWSVESGQIMFTTDRDMTAFNVRADRVDEIQRELQKMEQARQTRLNAARQVR